MNETEQECIILNSAWEMIDGMVNWAMFVKHDSTGPTNMMFETAQHCRLFNIFLGDFLSQFKAFKGQPIPLGLQTAPSNVGPADLTFLFYLRQVSAHPKLALPFAALHAAIEAFATWLEGDFVADGVNLHAIDVVADIRVSRYRYIKICGDIAKHSLPRLESNVRHIQKLLDASGHPITEQDAYLAVETFFEWFHDNIFVYHSSAIAEFLNNIRWAIFDYLQPHYQRSWHLTEQATESFPIYAFRYPEGCNEPVARAMYWNLMNRVRARPYMHRFVVSDSFKERY